MILNKLIILSFIFFLGCKSINTPVLTNIHSEVVKKIITRVDCGDGEEIRVDIDEQTVIYIDAAFCSIFKEYTSKNEVVYVKIKGVIEENSFDRRSGYYWSVSKKELVEKDLNTSRKTHLEFENFGLLGSEKLKKNIAYKVFLTNFDLKRENNSNSTKGKYELTLILKGKNL